MATKVLIIRSDLTTISHEVRDYKSAKVFVRNNFNQPSNRLKLNDTVMLLSDPTEPPSRYTVGELLRDI